MVPHSAAAAVADDGDVSPYVHVHIVKHCRAIKRRTTPKSGPRSKRASEKSCM